MNIPARCLYGRMSEIVEMIGGDNPVELTPNNVNALMLNMCQRIAELEKQALLIAMMEGQVDALTALVKEQHARLASLEKQVEEQRELLNEHGADLEAHKP